MTTTAHTYACWAPRGGTCAPGCDCQCHKEAEVLDAFRQMAAGASDNMTFTIARDPQPDTTFSKAGLEEFFDAIRLFVGARLKAHHPKDQTQPGVSELRADLVLTLDGQNGRVSAMETPWFIVDGTARKAATERHHARVLDDITHEMRALDRVLASLRALPDDNLARVGEAVMDEMDRRQMAPNASAERRDQRN